MSTETQTSSPAARSEAEAAIGGVLYEEIARRVGTPFYVYDGDAVTARVQRVKEALGPETALCYSVKANPSLAVCQLIAREGAGAEVASAGELVLARRAGFPAEGLLFAGPGKTAEELAAAVGAGISAVNVESIGELRRLNRAAGALGVVASAALRINPAGLVKGAHMRMGGGPQQFGVDEERMGDAVQVARALTHVRLMGLHIYTGTQMFDVPALLQHLEHVAEIAGHLSDLLGRPLDLIDFGGGFGVPYTKDAAEFGLDAFSAGWRGIVARCRGDARLRDARLVIELGRYLVAPAGVYVTRVVDVKESRGKTFVITDGGMNHHMAATGNFGQVFKKAYPIELLSPARTAETRFSLAGPCCTPLDVFGSDVCLPLPEPGDLVGVFASGAYGYSASSLGFLSHPTPAEVMVLGGRLHVLREPGGPEDVLRGQAGLGEAAA